MCRHDDKYLNQWMTFNINGVMRRAKCVDIEFQTGIGPIFLMKPKRGEQFWLSRREMKAYRVTKQATTV